MTYPPKPSSLVLRRPSSHDQEPPRFADALRGEAERCFRLAQGIASFELADELEAIGRALATEAEELDTATRRLGGSAVSLEHVAAAA